MIDDSDMWLEHQSPYDEVRKAGARPALVEEFGIRGLYGYRNISLESKNAATILIARNGTGKTTLLGALNAILTLQIYRLKDLEFDYIHCRIRGLHDEIILNKNDLDVFLETPEFSSFTSLANRAEVEGSTLFRFLMNDFEGAIKAYYFDEPAYEATVAKLLRVSGHDQQRLINQCRKIFSELFARNERLSLLRDRVSTALDGYEVVYLPTYRRVEISLTDDGDSKFKRRKTRRPSFTVGTAGLHTGEIKFGLADIPQRLSELNDEIIRRSNRGYREISENIINELINGIDGAETAILPTLEELSLFFSRIERSGRIVGPYYQVNPPDYHKIYSGNSVPKESKKFLTYFLGKLSNIIKITSEIEEPIGSFVSSCNRYLQSYEPSTSLDHIGRYSSEFLDGKSIELERTDLSLKVISLPSRKHIPLDALSSGEKQMISLFARLYLYPGKKIVLIDEPELSLSIDWQRGILPDILLSQNCEQVVAITHSPFVFDNALDEFARPLSVEFQPIVEPELGLGEIDDPDWDRDL